MCALCFLTAGSCAACDIAGRAQHDRRFVRSSWAAWFEAWLVGIACRAWWRVLPLDALEGALNVCWECVQVRALGVRAGSGTKLRAGDGRWSVYWVARCGQVLIRWVGRQRTRQSDGKSKTR